MVANKEKALTQYKKYCNQYQRKELNSRKIIITQNSINRQSIINCRA